MMNKLQVLEALKGKISNDYRGWLELLLEHIAEYGEQPTMTKLGKSFEHYTLWGNGKEIYGRECIINDADTIIIKDNKAYEIRNCELFVSEGTAEEYLNYKKPMCYNAYIDII